MAGYMSGEAYELPETRTELMEPKLACIEEVGAHKTICYYSYAYPRFEEVRAHQTIFLRLFLFPGFEEVEAHKTIYKLFRCFFKEFIKHLCTFPLLSMH
jgi:hypothetical protein